MGHAQGGVLDVACLLSKDGPQQFLLCSEFRFTLGRDLAGQDVAGVDVRADADHTVLVQVPEALLANVWDVPRDFFRPEFRLAGFHLVLLNVY